MFGGDFAPRGWARCHGQLLPISDHAPLFSLIGTTYGGDGVDTFALPDLREDAAPAASHQDGSADRTADLGIGKTFPAFAPHPRLGDALLLGLTSPVPGCAVRVDFRGSVHGVGVNPRHPPLVWQVKAAAGPNRSPQHQCAVGRYFGGAPSRGARLSTPAARRNTISVNSASVSMSSMTPVISSNTKPCSADQNSSAAKKASSPSRQ